MLCDRSTPPPKHRSLRLLATALLTTLTSGAIAQDVAADSIYYIGNSLTDTIQYQPFAEIVETQLGEPQPWGRHIIPGAPLDWIWDHPDSGFEEPPYGYYPQALGEHPWDFISLQPFDRQLDSDLATITRYVELAREQNPDVQILIHGRWPRRDGDADYATLWERSYTGEWDNTFETRNYLDRLTQAVQAADLGIRDPILVPIGEVLYQLDQQMQQGDIAGYDTVFDLYEDGIHLNAEGQYLATLTYLAVMYGVHPKTIDGGAIASLDPATKQAFDNTIWQVIQHQPVATSVAAPAPESAPSSAPRTPIPWIVLGLVLTGGLGFAWFKSQKS
jgi:hypothetical protein